MKTHKQHFSRSVSKRFASAISIKSMTFFFIMNALMITICFYQLTAQEQNTTQNQNQPPVLTQDGLVSIETMLLDNFEEADSWLGSMPRDWGIIAVQKREGAPQTLVQGAGDQNNKYALGAKVTFFKTGNAWFAISPHKEIEVQGNPKAFSVWVAGRSIPHELYAVLRDSVGDFHKIKLGDKLNFPGWNQIKGQVPLSILRGKHSKRFFNSKSSSGVYLSSMVVECDFTSTSGSYYLYLDQLEVDTDMYFVRQAEKAQNDMSDDW